ncbi:MAG: quercetin dioxygenase-like cupin family protein [Chlamydiales bacterium]|jgi:quercetin dioxygenase-like cupin family protein
MTHPSPAEIHSAALLLPCAELDPTLAFFTERLSFRLESIFPADAPLVAVLSGHGMRLQLEVGHESPPSTLRLSCDDPDALRDNPAEHTLTAPNGTRIELVRHERSVALPDSAATFTLSHLDEGAAWDTGRAGMRYRDLIPGRQNGRVIASHIAIEAGGPVPDYVHYHRVHFQMIYCYKGWVRVLYEDQGEPIVMHPGDCVLQPPEIRHRVLECSDGLEVVEITTPAAHPTFAEHDFDLPTPDLKPERLFNGQRFQFHQSEGAPTRPWPAGGFEARDLGMHAATDGIAQVDVLRGKGTTAADLASHDADLQFLFVLHGEISLTRSENAAQRLRPGDALVLPGATKCSLHDGSDQTELLVVSFQG